MRLLYIADGRSPISLSWIEYFIRTGHEVHLASTFPCEAIHGLASMVVIPVALSGIYGQPGTRDKGRGKLLRGLLPVALRTRIRQLMAPLSFSRAADNLTDLIKQIQPELVHAMRIPYEGMIASLAIEQLSTGNDDIRKSPLLISVWGNDFTLHAQSTRRMAACTRQALQTCTGLHTDCQRDQRLAKAWGFDDSKPRIVLPGGGGVRMDLFFPLESEQQAGVSRPQPGIPAIKAINPRGFRAYVRNDTFFHAIPRVINQYPNIHFICPGMKDEERVHRWVLELGIGSKVELLPPQSRQQMAELYRQAQLSLSITTHDGTPNTLLEAMACGCFPIAGDIESLREWITPGVNGLLVEPGNPKALAEAILKAISSPELRKQAGERNIQLVKERAEYERCMDRAEKFYLQLIGK
ncbi:MAG: glycosyltransferase family 4 protein [Anaerolineales bacterium]